MTKIKASDIGIIPNRQVPSRDVTNFFDSQRGKDFVESVRQKGVVDPVDIYEATPEEREIHGRGYSLKHGLHRVQAAILTDKEVPYNLCDPPTERDVVETNFTKNQQRGMTLTEKADWLERFLGAWKEEKGRAPTTAQICKHLGISESNVSVLKSHISAPPIVREALRNQDISQEEAKLITKESAGKDEVAETLVEEAKENRGGVKCKRGPKPKKPKAKPEDEPEFYNAPEERGDQFFEESLVINSDMTTLEALGMFIDTLVEVKGLDETTIKTQLQKHLKE